MSNRTQGVSGLERLDAVLVDDAIFELARLLPAGVPQLGGRPRTFPPFMWLFYEALISVFGSARRVEAELAHPLVWDRVCHQIRQRFPTQPDHWLGKQSMRRHHYRYGRDRYLTDPVSLERIATRMREIAAAQASRLGLLDPGGLGSWTHPDLTRTLHADGKVLTPLFRAKPGDTRVDRATGEIISKRAEPDAGLHAEGDGEMAWGTKFVLVACRSQQPHGRVILDVAWVAQPGHEARTAITCFERLRPHIPGAQAVVYDTALRGVHHQTLLRDLGLLPINRVTAAKAAVHAPRRTDGARREKNTYIEDREVVLPDGRTEIIKLYAQGGTLGIGQLTDRAELRFLPLRRVRTHRNADKNGKFRWYNDYQLPEYLGGTTITVRLHNTADDARRKLNRTENLRPIPPGDPDFDRLYARRNDAESINRNLEDTLWLRRAHSVGHARQHLNLIGYAIVVNALALHRHQRQRRQAA